MPVFFFLLWIIFNGRITLEIAIFGIVIAAAISYFAYRVIGYSPEHDLLIIRNFPLMLLYILNLVVEIIKAAAAVTGTVYHADEPDPVIVEFHSGLDRRILNVLLANSITLTPGTITVFQENDHFVVHCLRREYAEGLEDSSFIRLLRRVK